jgi:CO/xanthine dehydrogenase FAD-binding subunit
MKPAAFEYFRPQSLDEALALLEAHAGDAKPLAGGQSLIPAMNFRLAKPEVLVDLNALGELAYITREADGLKLGGMTRQRTVERSADVAAHAPLVAEAVPFIAHPAIRNRGTVGGSLSHADPSAELPAVMVALDATFTARSVRGARSIPAAEFFVGLFATALEPGELLTEIAIPAVTPRTGFAFEEISRRHGDFALAGVAASVTVDDRGRCSNARIALLSVGDGPVLAARASDALRGEAPSATSIEAAAHTAASDDIDPPGDIHASAAYRRRLVSVLTRRALTTAFERTHEDL